MELPVYKIKEVGKKFQVIRPDGSAVNDVSHETLEEAERQLNLLVAYKICLRETHE